MTNNLERVNKQLERLSSVPPMLDALFNERGQDCTLFIVRVIPIGDILYYLQNMKNRIQKDSIDNYCVVTHDLNTKRVQQLARFYWKEDLPLWSLSEYDILSLVQFLNFLGDKAPTHYSATQYDTTIPKERKILLANRPGLDYISFIKTTCWMETRGNKPPAFINQNDPEKIRAALREMGLKPGKTVVLSPKTVSGNRKGINLSNQFWTLLTQELKRAGFSVATNLSSPEERPLEGTVGLFTSLLDAPDYLNAAGALVSIRSGFCDLATLGTCKKVVLYPDGLYPATHKYRTGTYADFWSLSEAADQNSLLELIYHGANDPDLIPLIVGFIKRKLFFHRRHKRYKCQIEEYRTIQHSLIDSVFLDDYFQTIAYFAESHPLAIAFTTYGGFAMHAPKVPWATLGVDVPKNYGKTIKQRLAGMWDSQSDRFEFQYSKTTMSITRMFGDYGISAIIEADDKGTFQFSGFETIYAPAEGKDEAQTFRFAKEDVKAGINFAVFSIPNGSIIDCINVNAGRDPQLRIRRFR